jgi:hypothetical protein
MEFCECDKYFNAHKLNVTQCEYCILEKFQSDCILHGEIVTLYDSGLS